MNDHNAKRVVVLVDMDCFYCQVEVQHDQSLAGKPVAVVQYNSWRGGGIIAVNYEAREKGVDRHMRGDDAVKKCPDLKLVRVNELHGKADLSKYRAASQKVFEVLSEYSSCVQRASIDEAYIDLTKTVNDYISSNDNVVITAADLPNTFIQGYLDQNSKESRSEHVESWLRDVYNNELHDKHLLCLTVGAMMVEKLRELVFKKTGFRCSAGIANNKILAKLACGLHKPNQQTLLPPECISQLFETIPIKKVRNLGGKLGTRVKQEFNCEFMSDLAKIPLKDLQRKFDEKTSNFLYQISKGIDFEQVQSRLISKSIGSCKSFPLGLTNKEDVQHWLRTLMNDIVEKLQADFETNKRKATLMTISVRYSKKETNLPTSQCGEVNSYNINKLFESAYSMLCIMTENQKSSNWKSPLIFLGVAIGKFIEVKSLSSIDNYFNKGTSKEMNSNQQQNVLEDTTSSSTTNQSSENSKPFVQQQSCSKKSRPFSNNLFTNVSAFESKLIKNKTNANSVKTIKTMFTEMKNSSNSVNNDIETETENKYNSFFCNKLNIHSINQKPSTNDSSPTKHIQKKNVQKSNLTNSFFARKLEMISYSKNQTNTDSIPTTQSPVTENCFKDVPTSLLCEHCNRMIDINQYDEHVDFHIATNLSESLNSANVIQHRNSDQTCTNNSTTAKNNERGIKRKNNSIESKRNLKKSSCSNIALYFKPVSNSK